MIWRSRTRWVMRVEDTYWVFDHIGVVVAQHRAVRLKETGGEYFVDHYVSRGELIERTARGRRWGKTAEHVVLESGLRYEVDDAALEFLQSMISQVPDLRVVADAVTARRAGDGGRCPTAFDGEAGIEFRRAHGALRDRVKSAGDLYARMLRLALLLTNAGASEAALTAFARAALLLCEEDEPPAIDETSVAVQMPVVAELIAEMAARLDDENEGEAADAMHTCALLLGHREVK